MTRTSTRTPGSSGANSRVRSGGAAGRVESPDRAKAPDASNGRAGAAMTAEQARRFLKQNNVKFVLAQLVDIHGVAKAKAVPASHFDDILGDGAGFAGFAMW